MSTSKSARTAPIRAAADALRAALDEFQTASDTIDRNQKQRDALSAEVDSSRATADTGDEAALEKIGRMQTKLDLLTARAVDPAAVLPPLVSEVRMKAEAALQPLADHFRAEYDQLLAAIGAQLEQYEPDCAARRRLAQETLAARRLFQRISGPFPFALHERPVATARTVLEQADEIVKAEQPLVSNPARVRAAAPPAMRATSS